MRNGWFQRGGNAAEGPARRSRSRRKEPRAQHTAAAGRGRSPHFDPGWTRTAKGTFFRFPHVDPEAQGLEGESGVFVIWHAGVRPQWVYVGYARDLAAALHEVAGDERVTDYEVNGGLYLAWARIRFEYCEGIAAHLVAALRPVVPTWSPISPEVVPVPALAPGQWPAWP